MIDYDSSCVMNQARYPLDLNRTTVWEQLVGLLLRRNMRGICVPIYPSSKFNVHRNLCFLGDISLVLP